jgi:ATP-dependent DNA helicase RecG
MSRPALLFPLFASPTSIEGVGPKLAKMLERLGIMKIRDLAWLKPLNVIERLRPSSLKEAQPGQIVTLTVEVVSHTKPARKGQPYRVVTRDASGFMEVALFNLHHDYAEKMFPVGKSVALSGPFDKYRDRPQLVNPDYIFPASEADKIPAREAVYPLTAGLTNKRLRLLVAEAAHRAPELPEWCDEAFIKREKFPSWLDAVKQLHQPVMVSDLQPDAPARRRMADDELLSNQLAIALVRRYSRAQAGQSRVGDGRLRQQLIKSLPYQLTKAQSEAGNEIVTDMAAPVQMLRLLQGDVGSGKTIVALLAALAVIEAGYQAALMVPTEILARQHFEKLSELCKDLPIRIALLTGREKGKARDALLAELASGAIHLLIGTHALFQDEVAFANLGLAVVDEQHRFGVHQRLQIRRKGEAVDMLVMTATPIPRTLLLTAYGDMAVSKLAEKPPGRTPITTKAIPLLRYDEVVEGIGRVLTKGGRVYWVCPLVAESEDSDLAAATSRYSELHARFGGKVVLAHGQQRAAERDASMEAFASGAAQLLVATTVIEVGVDVPEASVMVIEHAERFGLAQLHQLRGRVGRGSAASSCLLLYAEPLGETAKARLSIMRETEDGFRIAEEDLRLRGAGELLGTRQSGLPDFIHADLAQHNDLLLTARDDAQLILERDPQLESARGQNLRILLHLYERQAAAAYLRSG